MMPADWTEAGMLLASLLQACSGLEVLDLMARPGFALTLSAWAGGLTSLRRLVRLLARYACAGGVGWADGPGWGTSAAAPLAAVQRLLPWLSGSGAARGLQALRLDWTTDQVQVAATRSESQPS